MTKKSIKFSVNFIKALGTFVSKWTKSAKQQGIAEEEIDTILTTTFNLLGKNAKQFSDKWLNKQIANSK